MPVAREGMAADPGARAKLGGAALDHAPGVDAVHGRGGERAGAAGGGAEEGARGPKHVVKTGKTTVLTGEQARELLDSIDTSTLVGLRDRALISVMTFAFRRPATARPAKREAMGPSFRPPAWKHEKTKRLAKHALFNGAKLPQRGLDISGIPAGVQQDV
jgi:hypothetical protein